MTGFRWFGLPLAVVALAIGPLVPSAAAQDGPSAVFAFRDLRAQAVAAANSGDLAGASDLLADADRLIVNHPGLLVLRARVAMAAGDPAAAAGFLSRYADLGLRLDVSRDPAFSVLAEAPEHAPLVARLAGNGQPQGAAQPLFEIDAPMIAEGLAWDAARSRFLVSGMRSRTVVQMDSQGRRADFLRDPTVPGILGIALDPERGVLWAAASGLAVVEDLPAELRDTTALLKIDLETGAVLDRYQAPVSEGRRSFGDVAVGSDGTAYVSDSFGGDVFRLRPGGEALETIVPAGRLGSPQGMVEAPDGRALLIADYSSGLHRLDRESGEMTAIAAPADVTLLGIDSILRIGDDLVAVQNGVSPQRVLRLRLDPQFGRVTQVEVLAASLPAIDEPSGATIVDGSVVFVSRSQGAAFDDEGRLRGDPPPPALVSRIPLDATTAGDYGRP